MENRWYDRNKKLGKYIESLHTIDPQFRNHIVHDLMDLVKNYNPALLDSFVGEYPLDTRNQRWYDQDPYLWILMNGLQFADDEVITKIIEYFEEL